MGRLAHPRSGALGRAERQNTGHLMILADVLSFCCIGANKEVWFAWERWGRRSRQRGSESPRNRVFFGIRGLFRGGG